jgi:CRISPR/Cas system CSM-associated protein Csm3 (group 7 of RAMP superfamily)
VSIKGALRRATELVWKVSLESELEKPAWKVGRGVTVVFVKDATIGRFGRFGNIVDGSV